MKRLSSALFAVLAISSVVVVTAAPARASQRFDSSSERTSARDTNAARAQRSKPKLAWNDELSRIARDHSADMARDGYIYHSRDLDKKVDGWDFLGENVGTGPDVESIDAAFMESAPHRRNILDKFTRIGVGVVVAEDGSLYLTQIFMRPSASRAKSSHPKARAPHRARPAPARAAAARVVRVAKVARPRQIPGTATGTVSALDAMTGTYALA
jgi:hypothetical protein